MKETRLKVTDLRRIEFDADDETVGEVEEKKKG